MRTRSLWAAGIVASAVLTACSVSNQSDALKITAWRNRTAMLFTNNETAPLSACHLYLTGSGRTWHAELREQVAPKKTVIVPWFYFRTNDNLPMPQDRGLGGDSVVVMCTVGTDAGAPRSTRFQL